MLTRQIYHRLSVSLLDTNNLIKKWAEPPASVEVRVYKKCTGYKYTIPPKKATSGQQPADSRYLPSRCCCFCCCWYRCCCCCYCCFITIHAIAYTVYCWWYYWCCCWLWRWWWRMKDCNSGENMQITSKSGQSLWRQWKFEYAKILKKCKKTSLGHSLWCG